MLEQASLVLALILQAKAGAAYPFESAETCAECHSAIHAEWRNTMHAQSYADPVFQVVLHQVPTPVERQACLDCHAPLARITGDLGLSNPVTREGVTCDLCHSVSDLQEGGNAAGGHPGGTDRDGQGTSQLPGAAKLSETGSSIPYVLKPGKVKRGPYKAEELTEEGHKNEYSPIHLKAEFCGACHEVVNKHGFHVMSTYTEWKTGPYAISGIQCQNCHMPEDIRFPIVDPGVAPSTKLATSHGFMGGHSEIRLEKAADINLLAERQKDGVEVIAYITNKESGHRLPTGIPTRRLVLTVRLLEEDGRRVLAQKSVEFRRVLGDSTGREIDGDDTVGLFLNAAQVLRDNRPAPKETVRESLRLQAPDTAKDILVEGVLEYDFKPNLPGRRPMRTEMARTRVPLEKKETRNELTKAIWIPLVVLLIAWALVYLSRRASAAGRVDPSAPRGKNG